jgi:sulfate transport system ATP-binding protein
MHVTVENVTKRFAVAGRPSVAAGRPSVVAGRPSVAGGTPAVADVSFTAPGGGITALLGPSGSGKSTVLRLIAGLEQPDAGRILVGDADYTNRPAQKRDVGFVFQSYALFKHMSVRGNIAFALNVRKVPKVDVARRVEELLALVQLDGLGDRYPAQLSGGQRQRVAFARALAIQPKMLLLDEPFGALDAQVRVELRDWLCRFQAERGVTTLFVTHDQDEAMEVANHVVVMNAGRVEQAGTPHDVYDRPATPFVASFVGGATQLRGSVQNGRASAGPFAVAVPDGAHAPDGAAVRAFVRPHDVVLTKVEEGGPEISVARVERLARLGASVKLSLKLPDGAPMTVQMSKAEVEALGIGEGDMVMANLREAKVFVEDYSI